MEEQLKKVSECAVPVRDSATMDGQGVHMNQEEKEGTTPPPPQIQPHQILLQQPQTKPPALSQAQPHQTLLQPQQPQLLQPKPPPQPQASHLKPPQPPQHPQITPKLLELQAKKQKKTLAGENQERINYLVQASRALIVMAAKTEDKEKRMKRRNCLRVPSDAGDEWEKRSALNQSVTGQERKKGKYVQDPSDLGGHRNCKGGVDCTSPLSKQKEVQKTCDGLGYKRKFDMEGSDDDESSSSSSDSSSSSSSSNTKKQEQKMGWEMRGQTILDDATLISINEERKLQNKSESRENQSNFEVKALGSSAEEKEKLVKSEENKSLDNIDADTPINDKDEKEMQNTENLEMSWEVNKDKEKVINYEIKSNDKKDEESQNLETIRENIEKMEGVPDELTVESKKEDILKQEDDNEIGNQAVCDMDSSDIESKVEIKTIGCGIENSAKEEFRAEDEAVQTNIEMMLQELQSKIECASNVSSKKESPSKISSHIESPYKSSIQKRVPHKTSSQKELPMKEAKHSVSKKESPKKKLSAKTTKNQSLQDRCTGLLALASQTGALASGVGRRCVLRLNPGLKRVICKGCGAALVYGVNARVRHRSRRQKHLVITCLLCHTIKRFNSDPKHKLWFDQQEAVV